MRIAGTPARPRLNVFRSIKAIYAQVIDDETGRTLAQASSIDSKIKKDMANISAIEKAKLVGRTVAERAQAEGITMVIFDRGGHSYHGRVKALADAAREAGLEF